MMIPQSTQITQGGEGNSKTSPPPPKKNQKPLMSRKWCFTINNYSVDIIPQLHRDFSTAKYVIGKEVGESGTPHLQGFVEFKNAKSQKRMMKYMPRAHLTKAKGNAKQNYDYCSKDGDFTTNMDFRTFKDKMRDKCLTRYDGVVWKPWQQEILDIKNDDRTIHWFYEEKGNVGKSFLIKYIALTRNVIICEGKKNDIYNQVNTMMEAEKEPSVIICDIPRTSIDYVNYGVLEKLKDGMIYSGKYEGGQCIFPPPLIICLANKPPDTSTMSMDRWNIRVIGE